MTSPLPLFDSHLHTPLCGHATGTPREYAQAALDAGLAGICFTDHMPMPAWYDAPWRMRLDQLAEYVDRVREVQADYSGRLEVRLGLEADVHPGTERFVERVLNAYPWDYVIGSVHYLGAWGFDNPEFVAEYEDRDLTGLYRDYYALVEGAARTGLFDSVGHLDLPKKFGHRDPAGSAALHALDVAAESGLALDFNTAGWRKPVAEAYPSPELTRAAAERNIPFVLGSDAHTPQEVGFRFVDALKQIQDAGGSVVTYSGRVRRG
ncbi:histidinol-phosphatase HisJ family protein [Deinococcus metallilatus]|uniref:Histidinol-phosphatase n=1 Tax=Deinococcus metallilatus TaxID=1211322 RepID=A0AAJ5JZR6_9DEIO|nr:histidinol-phosphatase [Deinococcus metallilatus]MBB5296044.1 histidinol-phosphatase (PHP family) [Deinococcus metallilatus]QBY08144.1 histidinol-phosphatase HisJ family protein [Deinococcus metallilatus]RXJ11876.1 histidinol-phosphatase HisJ family protein [Deinococcus metallilatus]TLK25892.1 histidinol-phosphatase [Deinococcus metallilatus]GMA14419.1 putative histidinol-phosphatase [Deinococcus metallilatus]